MGCSLSACSRIDGIVHVKHDGRWPRTETLANTTCVTSLLLQSVEPAIVRHSAVSSSSLPQHSQTEWFLTPCDWDEANINTSAKSSLVVQLLGVAKSCAPQPRLMRRGGSHGMNPAPRQLRVRCQRETISVYAVFFFHFWHPFKPSSSESYMIHLSTWPVTGNARTSQ